MNRILLTGAGLLILALAAGTPKTAEAFRGGFGPAGGFHAGGFTPAGGAWRAGSYGGAWHAGGVTAAERPTMQAASPARAGTAPAIGAAPGTATAGTPAAITPAASTAPPSSTAIIMAAAAGAAAPLPPASPRRPPPWRSEPSSPPFRRDAPINTSMASIITFAGEPGTSPTMARTASIIGSSRRCRGGRGSCRPREKVARAGGPLPVWKTKIKHA